MKWVLYVEVFCLFLFLSAIFLGVVRSCLMKKNNNLPKKKRKKGTIAVLIPAREEAKVIRGILKSLKKQTREVKMEDVYVVVEREEDPTVSICKEEGASVFVRKTIENRRRKGYALEECLQEILKTKHYDIYFIFDADNLLEKDYLEKLEKAYLKGYDLGFGYRNCKNGNDSLIAACSTLTFSMINTIGNQEKMKNTNNLILTGTGFFIAGEWVEKWGGYPFHSLTEDYELSLYATLHSLTTTYVEDAIFYDEQPTTYQDTVSQRVRWVRGFFTVRKEYIPLLFKECHFKNHNFGSQIGEMIGIMPILILVGSGFLYLLLQLVLFFLFLFSQTNSFWIPLSKCFLFFFFLYAFLGIISFLLLQKEQEKLNLKKEIRSRVCFFHPFYLMTYLPCALRAFFQKEVTWKKIEHKKTEIS